ncbi:MAG: MraY family glycosyltransferase [Candidatus Binatia bacterium]
MSVFAPAAVSFLAGLVLVPLVRRVARDRGVVASPRPDRWHRRPTALMGGIAIWAAVLAGIASASPPQHHLWGLLLGGSVLVVVGFVDDIVRLRPATKLVAQIFAAAVAIQFGFRVEFFPFEVLNLAASFLWIVAITNAVNLLDNMDGLAAGIVWIAVVALLGSAAPAPSGVTLLSMSMSGAIAAFLIFNFPPASVFMGDCGSMFLGFVVAGLALAGTHASEAASFILVPALILTIPILDTTLVTVTRFLAGRSIAMGGRDHVSHRLVRLGFSEKQAVILLWLLAVLAGAAAVLGREAPSHWSLGAPLVVIVGFAILGRWLSREDLNRDGGSESFAGNDTSPRRLFLAVGIDLVLLIACYAFAYALRFQWDPTTPYWARFEESLPIVLACTLVAFAYGGIYDALEFRRSGESFRGYLASSTLAVLLSIGAITLGYRFENYPRSVFLLYGALAFVALILSREALRAILARSWLPVLGAARGRSFAGREAARRGGATYERTLPG